MLIGSFEYFWDCVPNGKASLELQILLALEQTEDVLPAEIAEEILYAMRFV